MVGEYTLQDVCVCEAVDRWDAATSADQGNAKRKKLASLLTTNTYYSQDIIICSD